LKEEAGVGGAALVVVVNIFVCVPPSVISEWIKANNDIIEISRYLKYEKSAFIFKIYSSNLR
jgi:hypothetical protein